MEYHPEWEDDYKPPMPKVKKPKDSSIREDAILLSMEQLCKLQNRVLDHLSRLNV